MKDGYCVNFFKRFAFNQSFHGLSSVEEHADLNDKNCP